MKISPISPRYAAIMALLPELISLINEDVPDTKRGFMTLFHSPSPKTAWPNAATVEIAPHTREMPETAGSAVEATLFPK